MDKPNDIEIANAALLQCRFVNPDNPLSVAQNIKAMHEILKEMRRSFANPGLACHSIEGWRKDITKVLSQVEAK